jgi:hypothetical protein
MSGLDRDDIIRMAREVADKDKVDPVHNDMVTLTVDELGKLLAAERNRTWTQDHWTEYERSIAAAEREACAQICEEYYTYYGYQYMADDIRARGNDAP